MMTWFIYDISDNKIRNRIVKMAHENGLYRVQKSVFLGNIQKELLNDLVKQSKKIIDNKTDSVYIFPMCDKDFKKSILLGQVFDEKLITDEKEVMII